MYKWPLRCTVSASSQRRGSRAFKSKWDCRVHCTLPLVSNNKQRDRRNIRPQPFSSTPIIAQKESHTNLYLTWVIDNGTRLIVTTTLLCKYPEFPRAGHYTSFY
uniref:Uncharacterized protein n=1 Tax=Schistocephalus solidus TaxID=70667 RepID=A0A0X3NRF8_SCHSO